MESPLLAPLQTFLACTTGSGNGIGKIVSKTGALVPFKLNRPQYCLAMSMLSQARANRPIRVLVPKARKEGVSAFSQILYECLCAQLPHRQARTLAHEQKDTEGIWKIARTFNDTSDEKFQGKESKNLIEWSNGSEYDCHTAGTPGGGRGGTPFFLHLSELAYYSVRKLGQDVTSVTALINSVPDDPGTAVILESTGAGPQGEFYRRCQEVQHEGYAGDWSLCFIPWWFADEYERPAPEDWTPDEYLAGLGTRFGLGRDKLFWAHCKRAEQASEADFKREFPATVEECFEAATGRVYPAFGRQSHVELIDPLPAEAKLYRGLDWGGADPMVCLWCAAIPGPSGFTVAPSCENFIREMLSYMKHPDTGKPIDRNNHGVDVVRYLCTTFRLYECRMHVYRELYCPEFARGERDILTILDDVMDLSGWQKLPWFGEMRWVRGERGEKYEGNVADRSRPDTIQLFRRHGMEGLQGHRNLKAYRDSDATESNLSEIEQGIALVNRLILATGPINPAMTDLTPEQKLQLELTRPSKLGMISGNTLEACHQRELMREKLGLGRWAARKHKKQCHPLLGSGF